MNSQVTIKRSRGAVSGVALILLGLWGGLAPYIGPYLHFGYTPDTAWASTSGRLYYSAVPGAAALIGGILIAITRSRWVGVLGGVLAALGGLWFVVGSGVTEVLLKQSISPGAPLTPATGSTYVVTSTVELETVALFTGLGALIIFFAALACGRMTLVTAEDAEEAYYPDDDYAASTTTTVPATTGDYPSAAGQFPGPTTGQFARQVGPPANPPFPDAPNPFTPETSA